MMIRIETHWPDGSFKRGVRVSLEAAMDAIKTAVADGAVVGHITDGYGTLIATVDTNGVDYHKEI